MTQDLSREQAQARLETIRRVLLLVAVVYLGLHIWVSYRAFVDGGILAGVVTLLTLGFGDLYWTVYGTDDAMRQPALIAAVLAFASWLSRPWSSAYLLKLGLQSADWPKAGDIAADAGDDVDELFSEDVADDTPPVSGAGSQGRIGGAGGGSATGGAGEGV